MRSRCCTSNCFASEFNDDNCNPSQSHFEEYLCNLTFTMVTCGLLLKVGLSRVLVEESIGEFMMEEVDLVSYGIHCKTRGENEGVTSFFPEKRKFARVGRRQQLMRNPTNGRAQDSSLSVRRGKLGSSRFKSAYYDL